MVQENGMDEVGGTLLRTDFAVTSWKVMPANSGVCTLLSNPAKGSRAGFAGATSSAGVGARAPPHAVQRLRGASVGANLAAVSGSAHPKATDATSPAKSATLGLPVDQLLAAGLTAAAAAIGSKVGRCG